MKINIIDHGFEQHATIFMESIEGRIPVEVSNDGMVIELAIDSEIGDEESYQIILEDGKWRIVGADHLGLYYGIGKFLHTAKWSEREFVPEPPIRVMIPDCTYRCIYFSVHAYNWYHMAPAEELEKYLKELLLWGYNTIHMCVPIFNTHHFEEELFKKAVQKTRGIYALAKNLGMKLSFGIVPNQAPLDAPHEFDAMPMERPHPNTGRNICASKPEAVEYLKWVWANIFEGYKDIEMDYFMFWPYDEGGCSCEECKPWGANGYARLCMAAYEEAKRLFPNAKFVVSTWLFDKPGDQGEYEGLYKKLQGEMDWVDYIMADAHSGYPEYPLEHDVIKPIINFPEISMFKLFPWGGFGANPLLNHFQEIWDYSKRIQMGGQPYSEGLYEDISKIQFMNGIGSVLGYSQSAGMTATNNYATTEISKTIASSSTTSAVTSNIGATGTGFVSSAFLVTRYSDALMQGYGSRLFTELAFLTTERTDSETAVWMARVSDVPMPSTFADVVTTELDSAQVGRATEFTAGATSYTIDSIEDLYGLVILSQTNDLKGSTVTLAADIALNDNSAILKANGLTSWTAEDCRDGEDIVLFPWKPINADSKKFAGIFNGNSNTVSGLYMNDDAIAYMGFFGRTDKASTKTVTIDGVNTTVALDDASEIYNFRLENSYFNQKKADGYVGSIAGEVSGTVSNVYSDAIIEGNPLQSGGIVARANGQNYNSKTVTSSSATTVTYVRGVVEFKDCWFNGEIHVEIPSKDTYIGGIVAVNVQGAIDMTNCLFTGYIQSDEVDYTSIRVGGLCGNLLKQSVTSTSDTTTTNYVYQTYNATSGTVTQTGSAYTTLNLDSCISAGKIESIVNSNTYIGALLGCATDTSCLNMNQVFSSRKSFAPYKAVTGSTVTGSCFETTGDDRFLGYIEQRDGTNTYQLEFGSNAWVLRTDGVPIPYVLKDVVATEITTPSGTTMAQEIGLDLFKDHENASILQTTPFGEGNYLITYDSVTLNGYNTYRSNLVDLGFKCYADNTDATTNTDGVYSSTYYKNATDTTGEWVLNITFVENIGQIYISINTDVESLAGSLLSTNANATAGGTSAVTLSMIQLINEGNYGNGFVFQLPNGHFIISDGGREADAENLLTYLKNLAGMTNGVQNPVYIDAWFITHFHADHCGALLECYSQNDLRKDVYLDAVYASIPSAYTLNYWGAEVEYENKDLVTTVSKSIRGAMSFKKADGSLPELHQLHMGQRYFFNGITVDVVDTQEQHYVATWGNYNDPDYFNSSSTTCVFTLTSTGDKVYMGGDSNKVNMNYIMKAYDGLNVTITKENIGDSGYYKYDDVVTGTVTKTTSETLKDISVFVAMHHGKNTVDAFTTYLFGANGTATDDSLEVVLVPYYQVYQAVFRESYTVDGVSYTNRWWLEDDSSPFCYDVGDNNATLFSNAANNFYTYGYEDCVDGASATSHHGTVKLTFNSSAISTTIYKSWRGGFNMNLFGN